MHLFRIHPATGTGTDLLSTNVGGVRRHRESIGHNRSPGFRSRPSVPLGFIGELLPVPPAGGWKKRSPIEGSPIEYQCGEPAASGT